MRLYRRLRMASANRMAAEFAGFSEEQLRNCSQPEHPESFFAPTGGERVTGAELHALRVGLEEIAERCGDSSSDFDYEAALFLFTNMDLNPVEAARPEVWSCFALTLVPHLVHRRFSERGRVIPERFLGSPFGGRNAFGRLWWRAYLLQLPDDPEPFRLIRGLGEDQIVQLLERPRVSGYRPLATAIAAEWLNSKGGPNRVVPAEALMRDAMKRIRRLSAFVAWEVLEAAELEEVVRQVFRQSERALTTNGWTDDGEDDAPLLPIAPPDAGIFTPLDADIEAAERLDQWVASSPLTEPKRSFVREAANGLRTGQIPRIAGYKVEGRPPMQATSQYATGIWEGLRERGVRLEVLNRMFA